MKKIIFIFLLTSFISYSQTKLYVHPDADTYVANTETIAILPLDVQVKMRPKQMNITICSSLFGFMANFTVFEKTVVFFNCPLFWFINPKRIDQMISTKNQKIATTLPQQ